VADVVVPGVWWLHETRGSNVYLVEAADGQFVLVDTGFLDSADGIEREIDRIVAGRPVTKILLTHGHFDHAGAAGSLRERLKATVVAGRADCEDHDGRFFLAQRAGRSHFTRRLAGLFLRRHQPIVEVACPIEGEAEVAPGILAIPIPGHTPGSYCYLDTARGVAFVGDLVISHVDGLARPLPSSNTDEVQYLDTLRQFADRAPDVGCPGHGKPVLSDFDTQVLGLSLLPRGITGMFSVVRFRRLLRFTFGMSRRRKKSGD
jgi:hydroxyacylglutathione hydrolase